MSNGGGPSAPAMWNARAEVMPLARAQIAALLPLWRDYQRFYEVPSSRIDGARNRAHIKHILTHPERGQVFLLHCANRIEGFATIYYTFSSTAAAPLGVINDLYVAPAWRGRCLGQALLDHCIAFLHDRGVAIAEWATRPDNRQARHLYDHYSAADTWLVYRVFSGKTADR